MTDALVSLRPSINRIQVRDIAQLAIGVLFSDSAVGLALSKSRGKYDKKQFDEVALSSTFELLHQRGVDLTHFRKKDKMDSSVIVEDKNMVFHIPEEDMELSVPDIVEKAKLDAPPAGYTYYKRDNRICLRKQRTKKNAKTESEAVVTDVEDTSETEQLFTKDVPDFSNTTSYSTTSPSLSTQAHYHTFVPQAPIVSNVTWTSGNMVTHARKAAIMPPDEECVSNRTSKLYQALFQLREQFTLSEINLALEVLSSMGKAKDGR